MRCRACEFVNLEGANYCAHCGVVLALACSACGALNQRTHIYCSSCGSRLADVPDHGKDEATRPAAERRQLTVMFIDLVGSAALSTQLDAEDFGRLVRRYRMVCAAAAQAHGGYVVQYAGDGVVVYFGYPKAREDVAEQAVRAALKAVAAVGRLTFADVTLAARVGISTGTVVIDPTGCGSALDQSVFGDTPNLAARLQNIAAPGAVALGDSTRQIAGGAFRYRDLGLHDIKGFPEPMRVWQVEGESKAESRFDARQAEGVTPLVNREAELAQLLDLWELARNGAGQVVLLSGEPGIGKSRLALEFTEKVKESLHARFRFHCSPRHANTPLYPIVSALTRAATIEPDQPAAEKLRRLEAFVDTCSGRVDEAVPLLAALLHIAVDERYPRREIASPKDREELLHVLQTELLARASRMPLLLVFEDVQWMDPSTGAVLHALVSQAAAGRVMVLVTFRTGFSPPWPQDGATTMLPLSRLSEEHSAALVRQLAEQAALPEAIAARIVEKTGGVPLFIEEVTRNVVEERQTSAEASPTVAVPTTLRDSLMARLDRYQMPKTVAQVAAVLGTTFGYPLLKAVAGMEDDALRSSLDQLVAGRILQRRRVSTGECYEFRHALIRDVAYDAVLKAQRRRFHARAAEVLESQLHEQVATEPELVAHHYSLAEMPMKAAVHWLHAGSHASRRSANVEAVSHLYRALDEIAGASAQDCPASDCQALELKVRIALGAPLIAVSGWAAPEVEATHIRARSLCDAVGSLRERFDVNRGLFNVFVLRGQLAEAQGVGEELLAMAEDARDRALHLETFRALGICSFLGGRLEESRERMDKAIQLYSPEEHYAHTFIYGANPEIVAGCWRSWTDCLLGFPQPAQKRIEDVVRLAERLDHPFSLGYALCFAASIAQTRGEVTMALSQANAALDLAVKHHHSYWKAWASIIRGWAIARLGRTGEGLQQLRQGIADYSATGAEQITSYSTTLLAESLLTAGLPAEASDTVDLALEMQQTERVSFYLAEGHRLRGAIREVSGANPDDVRADLLQAADVAQRQGARLFRVRALRDLASRYGEPFASSPEIATTLDDPGQRNGRPGGSEIRETA